MDGKQMPPMNELPRPQQEQGIRPGVEVGREQFGQVSKELHVAPMPGEKLGQANNAAAQAMTLAQPQAAVAVTLATDGGQAVGGATVADGKNELIEKEWIDKAKNIVARTQGDPRAKSTQLTVLKKEYIEKRYGKHIAVPSTDDPIT